MTLLKQQAKSEWVSVLVWGLLIGGWLLFMVVLYGYLRDSELMRSFQEMLAKMPPAMAVLYGSKSGFISVNGWLQSYAFGSWLSIPMVIFTGLFVADLVTREIDRRTMEFVLSLPISRTRLLISRWVGLVLALLLLHLIQLVAVLIGVRAIGESISLGRYLVAELNSVLLYLALGDVFLLISLFINDYGPCLSTIMGLGLGLFFFHVATDSATGALKAVRDALPFAHLNAAQIITQGEVPVGDMALLAAIAAVALLISIYVFDRKQIAV